jgi:hypothetical protein
LPDGEKVRIAATSSMKLFNKLFYINDLHMGQD